MKKHTFGLLSLILGLIFYYQIPVLKKDTPKNEYGHELANE